MSDSHHAPLPAVVELGYGAWLWLDERCAAFPAAARRQLGHRILDAALDALADTTEAAVLPRGQAREARLCAANRALTLLRILLRGARDRRYLSVGQHEHAMRLVDDWGRQVGGWLRAERRGRAAAQQRQGAPPREPGP
ncbi:MAG: four helix bundle protein [Deltaproteobacteria bacterium]|nr:four helix bundle protein [Deltaproteobacteria bacterium]